MTFQQIINRQESWKEFTSTEIGKAFDRYERLRDLAQQKDARLEYTDVGYKSAKEAWIKSDEARAGFLKLLGYEEPK